MIKSNVKVDEAAVKKYNEEQIWSAHCKLCGHEITGTLSEIKAHMKKCHGK